jgi:archaellum component FlaC
MAKDRSKKTYSEDQVVVILEDIKDEFGILADGLKTLNDKFDRMEVKMDNLETKVDYLLERVNALEEKVNGLEIKVDGIADDILDIKNKLNQKVSLEDFHKLEKKVFKLEKLVLSKL